MRIASPSLCTDQREWPRYTVPGKMSGIIGRQRESFGLRVGRWSGTGDRIHTMRIVTFQTGWPSVRIGVETFVSRCAGRFEG
jgi:hypothetical protein